MLVHLPGSNEKLLIRFHHGKDVRTTSKKVSQTNLNPTVLLSHYLQVPVTNPSYKKPQQITPEDWTCWLLDKALCSPVGWNFNIFPLKCAGKPQLSIKACPNIWLPKTLISVQLQPNLAEHCPAMVTYSPSNQSPQYKNKRLFSVLSIE